MSLKRSGLRQKLSRRKQVMGGGTVDKTVGRKVKAAAFLGAGKKNSKVKYQLHVREKGTELRDEKRRRH